MSPLGFQDLLWRRLRFERAKVYFLWPRVLHCCLASATIFVWQCRYWSVVCEERFVVSQEKVLVCDKRWCPQAKISAEAQSFAKNFGLYGSSAARVAWRIVAFDVTDSETSASLENRSGRYMLFLPHSLRSNSRFLRFNCPPAAKMLSTCASFAGD